MKAAFRLVCSEEASFLTTEQRRTLVNHAVAEAEKLDSCRLSLEMPSLLERLSSAVSAFRGKEERPAPLALKGMFRDWGMGPQSKPAESLAAYGDNVWLYAGVNKNAQELARTQFQLQTKDRNGEIKIVRKQ